MRAEIVIAIIGAAVGITTSIVTATAATDSRISTVNTDVKVLQERQARQYEEISNSLTRIEKRLDSIK